MADDQTDVPDNYLGITDRDTLDRIAGGLAARRLAECERTTRLSSFTRDSLLDIHRYLFQDVYPWAGQLRSGDVMAMGIPLCRPQFVSDELDRVMRNIAQHPVSTTDRDKAVNTVAEHWGELTAVHPMEDGNSRTQRFFFDQMLRAAGWVVDWTRIDASRAHAARYVAVVEADHSFLAQALAEGVMGFSDTVGKSLSRTEGTRDNRTAAEIFHDMRRFRRQHPGRPYPSG